MGYRQVPLGATESAVRIVVTRADGTVENRGIWAYYSNNPIKHWAVNVYIAVRNFIKGYK